MNLRQSKILIKNVSELKDFEYTFGKTWSKDDKFPKAWYLHINKNIENTFALFVDKEGYITLGLARITQWTKHYKEYKATNIIRKLKIEKL